MASLPASTWKQERETTQSHAGAPGLEKGKVLGPVPVPSLPIRSGNLLIREGIVLPTGLEIALKPFSLGWQMVRQPRPAELERALNEEGWSLFSMAGDIAESAIALNWEHALQRATQKLCIKASKEGLNAIEVTQITMRKVLGICWVRVTAKLRHVQKGPYLFKTAEQMALEIQRVRIAVPTIQVRRRHQGREYREYKSM